MKPQPGDGIVIVQVGCILLCGLFVSYCLALLGEPQSVWLWQLVGLL